MGSRGAIPHAVHGVVHTILRNSEPGVMLPHAPRLTHQKSASNCTPGVSFGCSGCSRTMWISGGCRGYFECEAGDHVGLLCAGAPLPATGYRCRCPACEQCPDKQRQQQQPHLPQPPQIDAWPLSQCNARLRISRTRWDNCVDETFSGWRQVAAELEEAIISLPTHELALVGDSTTRDVRFPSSTPPQLSCALRG